MEAANEDRFVVFLLDSPADREAPTTVEHEVASCTTYHEAEQVRRTYRAAARDCVIRFVGPAGGGD